MERSHLKALCDWGWTYVESGVPVLLLLPRIKKPVADPDGTWCVFTEWEPLEKALHQHPDANLGLLLGPEKNSPLMAVDIDGQSGLDQARELGVSSREEAWVARTGRGNWHIVYCHPEGQDFQRTIHAEQLSLDLLTNGYIVVEPSITDGPYRWQPGHSPKDIPVPELLPPPQPLIKWWQALNQAKDQGQGWQPEGLVEALKGAPEGERDITGYRLACRHLSLGLHPDEVEEFLVLWAAKCQPPIGSVHGDPQPEAWARDKVKSAVRAFDKGKLHRKEPRGRGPRRRRDGIPIIEAGP